MFRKKKKTTTTNDNTGKKCNRKRTNPMSNTAKSKLKGEKP